MRYQTIETRLVQGVAVIRLNRPELRNPMNDTRLVDPGDAAARASYEGREGFTSFFEQRHPSRVLQEKA